MGIASHGFSPLLIALLAASSADGAFFRATTEFLRDRGAKSRWFREREIA
jgi:hypothetical protein